MLDTTIRTTQALAIRLMVVTAAILHTWIAVLLLYVELWCWSLDMARVYMDTPQALWCMACGLRLAALVHHNASNQVKVLRRRLPSQHAM